MEHLPLSFKLLMLLYEAESNPAIVFFLDVRPNASFSP